MASSVHHRRDGEDTVRDYNFGTIQTSAKNRQRVVDLVGKKVVEIDAETNVTVEQHSDSLVMMDAQRTKLFKYMVCERPVTALQRHPRVQHTDALSDKHSHLWSFPGTVHGAEHDQSHQITTLYTPMFECSFCCWSSTLSEKVAILTICEFGLDILSWQIERCLYATFVALRRNVLRTTSRSLTAYETTGKKR